MAQRNELVARAAVVGIDPTAYPNDSKLESKVLWAEKNATTFTGTIATTTLTSDATTVADGDTVTIGAKTYTFKTALTEAPASATLTSDATNPSDGERISVRGRSYTFRTALTSPAVADEILIGADAATTLDNVKAAINNSGTAGTNYSTGTTIHPDVTATTNTDTTQVVQAKSVGTAANAWTVSDTSSHLSWSGSTLSGGAAPVENEVLIGANAAANLVNIKAAINDSGVSGTNYSSKTSAHKEVVGSTIDSTTLVINARNFAYGNGSVATTTTASHVSFTGSTLASGVAKVVAAATTNDQLSGAVDHI